MNSALVRQANHIPRHMPFLALFCDPMYITMRQRVVEQCSNSFLKFDNISFTSHCQWVLRELCNGDDRYKTLLRDYVSFKVKLSKELLPLRQLHPRLGVGATAGQV